jgi:hypothetical protein
MRGGRQVVHRLAVERGDEALLGGHGFHGQEMRMDGNSAGLISAAGPTITLA